MSNIARWRKIPEEQIRQVVTESKSFREVAGKLGYVKNGGGTITSLHKMCEELQIDTSHFLGQGWNKNNYDYSLFTTNSPKKNGSTTAQPLIALRGHKCENCGLTEWLGQKINLEVHHINGDRTDNRLENLQLLCPNCHSYTPTFTKKGDKRIKSEEEFVQALKDAPSIRQALLHLDLSAKGANYDRAWELIDKYNIDHLKRALR